MSDSEASLDIKPQKKFNRYRSLKKSVNRYFFAVCVLFLLVLLLCANSYNLYSSYKSFRDRFETSLAGMRSIALERTGLVKEKENIKSENDRLMKEFESIKEINDRLISQNREILNQVEEIRKTNDELVKRNKELIDDNIALQNSLKKAAAVGIKPKNFTDFDGLSSRGELDRGKYLGKFLGTAYTPSAEECGNNHGITNSGKPIIPGISIAIDKKFWPYGTVFYIKGLGYAVAMDTGSAIKGKNRFDFAVFDRNFAKTLGSRHWDVYLVKQGKGYVEEVNF